MLETSPHLHPKVRNPSRNSHKAKPIEKLVAKQSSFQIEEPIQSQSREHTSTIPHDPEKDQQTP